MEHDCGIPGCDLWSDPENTEGCYGDLNPAPFTEHRESGWHGLGVIR